MSLLYNMRTLAKYPLKKFLTIANIKRIKTLLLATYFEMGVIIHATVQTFKQFRSSIVALS